MLGLVSVLREFSLFGDPAQGIYGWHDDADALWPTSFLDDVQNHSSALEEAHLTLNHRTRNADLASLGTYRAVA